MEFKENLRAYQARVEAAIADCLPPERRRPSRLHEAMRYSMQAGGKRLRPVLVLCASDRFDPSINPLPAAVAVECIHTYSLIHDDLPSIDDGDLRRGMATCHRKFDEPTALLAGDALLTYAFQLLARRYRDQPAVCAALVGELAEASGSERLIGGQMEDIMGEGAAVDESTLRFIHLNKTSALIEASLVMGGLVGQAPPDAIETLRRYGRCIGLAFQIVDDILDATSDAATLGKDAGSDAALEKTTYVKLYGLERSRELAAEQTQAAIELAAQLPGDPAFLTGLAKHLEGRLS